MATASIHERFPGTCCIALCRDVENSGQLRGETMAEHLRYIESILDELALAAPLFDATGHRPVGSLYCVKTRDPAKARALVEADPLYRAGVFASVEIHATMLAAGGLVGGKAW